MTFMLLVICLITFCLLTLSIWRLRVNFADRRRVSEPESAFSRSADFYRPMQRLLTTEDISFLRSQPGITPRKLRQMQFDRRRIFRQYLRSLGLDLSLLMNELRAIMVDSPESRADLAEALFKSRVLFASVVIAVECRLFMHACGFQNVAISVTPLTEGLAQLRRQLELLTPQPALALL